MKVSSKQAKLLAAQVVKELNAAGTIKMTPLMKAKVETFVDKHKELVKKKDEAQMAINKHDASLASIIGSVVGIYDYTSAKIIQKWKERHTPTVGQIEDEIILQAMFSNEDDLKKFIDKIVSKYSKKQKPQEQLN